jgi:hypothetical protein
LPIYNVLEKILKMKIKNQLTNKKGNYEVH